MSLMVTAPRIPQMRTLFVGPLIHSTRPSSLIMISMSSAPGDVDPAVATVQFLIVDAGVDEVGRGIVLVAYLHDVRPFIALSSSRIAFSMIST